jgi:hypothetical protein
VNRPGTTVPVFVPVMTADLCRSGRLGRGSNTAKNPIFFGFPWCRLSASLSLADKNILRLLALESGPKRKFHQKSAARRLAGRSWKVPVFLVRSYSRLGTGLFRPLVA